MGGASIFQACIPAGADELSEAVKGEEPGAWSTKKIRNI